MHTKGDWYIDKQLTDNGAPIIVSDTCWTGRKRQIAKVLYHIGSEDPEVQDNARLITAAPKLLAALEGALEAMDEPAVQAAGEWQTGLFCGLEDRNLTDRYEACMYGYEQALEKVQEWVLCDFEAAIAEAKNDKAKERGSNEQKQ